MSWESMDPWKFVDDLVSSNTSDVPELELKRLYVKVFVLYFKEIRYMDLNIVSRNQNMG